MNINPSENNESRNESNFNELYAQLFAVLSARHRDENNRLIIGVKEEDLRDALQVSKRELDNIIKQFQEQIISFGLEVVRYSISRVHYYAIRTIYGVPSELTDEEYATLGAIISLTEDTKLSKTFISRKKLEAKLVAGGYLTKYQLERILRSLEEAGYIINERGKIKYGSRTKIEFDEDRRKAIAEETRKWLI